MVTAAMKLRHLLLERKVMTNLDSILKSIDITLPTKVHLFKAMVFPVVMYGCESWNVKKAETKQRRFSAETEGQVAGWNCREGPSQPPERACRRASVHYGSSQCVSFIQRIITQTDKIFRNP